MKGKDSAFEYFWIETNLNLQIFKKLFWYKLTHVTSKFSPNPLSFCLFFSLSKVSISRIGSSSKGTRSEGTIESMFLLSTVLQYFWVSFQDKNAWIHLLFCSLLWELFRPYGYFFFVIECFDHRCNGKIRSVDECLNLFHIFHVLLRICKNFFHLIQNRFLVFVDAFDQ